MQKLTDKVIKALDDLGRTLPAFNIKSDFGTLPRRSKFDTNGALAQKADPRIKLGSILAAAASCEKTAAFTYDFADLGGVQGDIDLGGLIPDDAVVLDVLSDAETNLASGGAATVGIFVGATEILPAAAFGTYDALVDHTLAAPIKVVTGGPVTFKLAAADLTAGKVTFFIKYLSC